MRFSKLPPYCPGRSTALRELVPQVAVAVLDVDEVEAGLLGQPGGPDEVLDQLVDLVIAHHLAGWAGQPNSRSSSG